MRRKSKSERWEEERRIKQVKKGFLIQTSSKRLQNSRKTKETRRETFIKRWRWLWRAKPKLQKRNAKPIRQESPTQPLHEDTVQGRRWFPKKKEQMIGCDPHLLWLIKDIAYSFRKEKLLFGILKVVCSFYSRIFFHIDVFLYIVVDNFLLFIFLVLF